MSRNGEMTGAGLQGRPDNSEMNMHPGGVLKNSCSALTWFAGQLSPQTLAAPIRKDVIYHCNTIRPSQMATMNYENVRQIVQNRSQRLSQPQQRNTIDNYDKEESLALVWLVSKMADNRQITHISNGLKNNDWNVIDNILPGRETDCKTTWQKLHDNQKVESWSHEQSRLLLKVVKKYGKHDWQLVAQKWHKFNKSSNPQHRRPEQFQNQYYKISKRQPQTTESQQRNDKAGKKSSSGQTSMLKSSKQDRDSLKWIHQQIQTHIKYMQQLLKFNATLLQTSSTGSYTAQPYNFTQGNFVRFPESALLQSSLFQSSNQQKDSLLQESD